MRIILIFFILGLILLIQSTPDSFATLYENPTFEFSIDYPEGWDYVDELIIMDGVTYAASFYDDKEEWWSFIDVRFVESEFGGKFGTDKKNLEVLEYNISGWCELASFEIDGFTCSNFYLEYLRVVPTIEYKAYEVKYTWIESHPDETYFDNIIIVRYIPTENGNWYLYSESARERFSEYEDLIYDSFDSFYSKDIEEIGQNNLDALLDESGILVNDQYGFSITPPQNWELGTTNFALGKNTITRFFCKSRLSGIGSTLNFCTLCTNRTL